MHNADLSIVIENQQDLVKAYMPFIKSGGLFTATECDYKLGDELALVITLMDQPSRFRVAGKVVWINPPGTLGNKPCGVGLQFIGEGGKEIVNIIESKLSDSDTQTQPTHTM